MSTTEPRTEGVVEVPQVAEAVSAPGPSVLPRGPSPKLPWAEQVLGDMTLRRKIGQMIMPLVLGTFSPEGTEAHVPNGAGSITVAGNIYTISIRWFDVASNANRTIVITSVI